MQSVYAQGLFELLKDGKDLDSLLRSLSDTLEKRGHTKLYVGILKELITTLEESDKKATAKVIVARESDLTTFNAQIQKVLESAENPRNISETVDDTLIGGYVVKTRNEIIDASQKRALLSLYENIIT